MSLLMDALKRAEQAKRQAEGQRDEPAAASEGADVAQQPEGNAGLPELPGHLEILDDEIAVPRGPAADAAPHAQLQAAGDARRREAAQNVFRAKQPEPRRPFYLTVGILTTLAVIGIGVYFWLQVQPASSRLAARPLPAAVSAPAVAVDAVRPPLAASASAAAPVAVLATPAAARAAGEQPRSEAPRAESTRDRTRARSAAAAEPSAHQARVEDDRPIRISHPRLRVNPVAERAYQAYQAGDMARAQRDYEQVLKSEPKNTDALLGLAALAVQRGGTEAAETYYRRALESDPRNAAAFSGLVALHGALDPVEAESRIKTLLAGQPDSAVLHFTLGNVYARQGRWTEAQQAYFKAYTAEGDNPDFMFNLAVSLDQLRQPALALQYYQNALAAASGHPAAFDRNQAARRVRELRQ